MKVCNVPSFKADFDTNKKSTVNFLTKAFYQAIRNQRINEFDDTIYGIKDMPFGKIALIKTSPDNDVFIVNGIKNKSSLEVTLPKKNNKTCALDTLIGLGKILNQLV